MRPILPALTGPSVRSMPDVTREFTASRKVVPCLAAKFIGPDRRYAVRPDGVPGQPRGQKTWLISFSMAGFESPVYGLTEMLSRRLPSGVWKLPVL